MIFGIEHIITAGLLTLTSGGYTCPAQPAPTVVMKTRNGTPKYYYNIPSAQLQNIQTGNAKPNHLGPNYVIGGLTHGKIQTEYSTDMYVAPVGGNAHCVSVKQITVTLDYQPDVYIAAEYRPGSCHYNVTMQHEVQHVNLELITLNEFLPRFQSNIQQALFSMPPPRPVPAQNVPQVQQFIQARVSQAVQQVMEQMIRVRDSRQGGIDTPQEYARLQQQCAHEPNPIAFPGQQHRRR